MRPRPSMILPLFVIGLFIGCSRSVPSSPKSESTSQSALNPALATAAVENKADQNPSKAKQPAEEFDTKALYNAVLNKLLENHPDLASDEKREAFKQRWTRKDISFGLIAGEKATDAEIERMVQSAGGFAVYSRSNDENKKSAGGSKTQFGIGISPHFEDHDKVLKQLPPNARLQQISDALRVTAENRLVVGTFTGGGGRGKLYSNDIIHEVNGKSVIGMTLEEVMAELDLPNGQAAKLTVKRNNFKGGFDTITVDIRGQREIVPPVELIKLDGDIYLLRVRHIFDDYGAFCALIADAVNKAAKGRGMILDLRGCGGQCGDVTWPVCEYFLKEGIIRIEKFRRDNAHMWVETLVTERLLISRHPFGYGGDPGPKYSYQERFERALLPATTPLVVLIDGKLGASAEYIAAILQGNKRAFLVGTETAAAGKHVDRLVRYELPHGRYLYIQEVLFVPAGTDPLKWNWDSVKPDREVQPGADPNRDLQLEAALEHIQKQLPR